MQLSSNATYSLSLHSEAVLATITTFQHNFNICTQNAGPASKQALHHSKCFTHTLTLMEASQRVVISKTEHWPTKAETWHASIMFSCQSQASVMSLHPCSFHSISPCEVVKSICQNDLNLTQSHSISHVVETKWAKRRWGKLAYKLVLCGLSYWQVCNSHQSDFATFSTSMRWCKMKYLVPQ